MFEILGSLAGGLLQSSAASNAANTAASSSRYAADVASAERQKDRDIEQQRYDINRSDRAPFMGASRNALAQYLREMGLEYDVPRYGTQATPAAVNPISNTLNQARTAADRKALRDYLLPQYTSTQPLGVGVGYGWGEGDASSAPSVDEAGLEAAITAALQNQAAQGVQGVQGGQVGQVGQVADNYATTAPTDVQLDPGYQFGLEQGQQALDRKTAQAGGRVSGAALKAAQRYGTDYATTGYGAAYNRKQDRLTRLASLAGLAIPGASGSTGQQPQSQVPSIIQQGGQTQAAAQLAQGNIWGNTLNQGIAAYNRGQAPNDYGYSQTGYGAPITNWGGFLNG